MVRILLTQHQDGKITDSSYQKAFIWLMIIVI